MPPLSFTPNPLPKPQWWVILPSLFVTSVGWGARFCDWRYADVLIIVGTGLVVCTSTLALRRLARQAHLPVGGPLWVLAMALALLVLEPLCRGLAPSASLLLRPLGETTAALGVVWLLLNLHRFLAISAPVLKHKPQVG